MSIEFEIHPSSMFPETGLVPPRPSVSPYVPFMTVVTGVYLVWELAFNARLLDVTGGFATPSQISSIEKWGRIISGIAATLALWGMVIFPRVYRAGARTMDFGSIAAVLAVSGAVTIFAVYHLERHLIDYIVDKSNGEERRAASHLAVVSAGVLQGNMVIIGMDLTKQELAKPAGKAFLSLFPLVALSTPDLARKTETILHDAIRLDVATNVGPAEAKYNDIFVPSVKELRNTFNEYRDGVNRYQDTLSSIPQQQNEQWRRFSQSLRQRTGNRYTPQNLPPRYWRQTTSQVRSDGVDVPIDWNPGDRQTFNAAIDRRIRADAANAFASRTSAIAGESLQPNLEWSEFVAEPSVQSKWRSNIGAPVGVILTPKMGEPAFARDVYEPNIEQQTNERVSKLLMPPEAFSDGGDNEETGRHAMEALAVPPIALTFSLIGAMVHIFKSLNFASKWAFPAISKRRRYILVPLVVVGLSAFMLPNDVSTSNGFGVLEEHTRTAWGFWGAPMTAAIKWTVQAQPYFYPLNESVRHILLRGYSFGYEPRGDISASPEKGK